MLIALLPLLFVILGILVYVLSSNGKLSETGRIMYFCGLLVLVWHMSGKMLHLP